MGKESGMKHQAALGRKVLKFKKIKLWKIVIVQSGSKKEWQEAKVGGSQVSAQSREFSNLARSCFNI